MVQRGSLTIWIEESAIEGWVAKKGSKEIGRPRTYSDEAILMLLVLREVYQLPLRATQGFVTSIFQLMGLFLPIPSYTQICRRAQKLGRIFNGRARPGTVDIVFDSTGLKVYGEGEWKVRTHGVGKRRTWKKWHVGIDRSTQEILVSELTSKDAGDSQTAEKMLEQVTGSLRQVLGDGAYDSGSLREAVYQRGGELIAPPPKNATYKGSSIGWQRERDEALAEIEGLGGGEDGRKLWKRLKGYHKRSLVETTMYRLKQILGRRLKSRCDTNQSVESQCKSIILNRMSELGLPIGHWTEEAV